MANQLLPADREILVTWSLLYASKFASLYRATSPIYHPPYRKWGLNLSNCFTYGSTLCGPDSDDDGVINAVEIYPSGTDPYDSDTDNDGCSDGEESGVDPTLGGDRVGSYYWHFYDVNADQETDNTDTLLVLQHFGHTGNQDALDNLLDRYSPDSSKPWRSGEASNGIDTIDALASLQQFGHSCVAAP